MCEWLYFTGLGKTVPELEIENAGVKAIEKTLFSMCLEPVIAELSTKPDVNSILLCGIEAHVCIQQTAIDLRSKGFEVFVIADACSSRGHVERYEKLLKMPEYYAIRYVLCIYILVIIIMYAMLNSIIGNTHSVS